MEQKMFCYQCQETSGCKGCTACGVCGKTPEVAAMQDLLVYVTKGLSAVTTQLRAEGQTVDKAVRTIMLYDCGANLETQGGLATYNLRQVLRAKFSANGSVASYGVYINDVSATSTSSSGPAKVTV